MPKFHELRVNGGDRGSLLQLAAIARLVDLPSSETTKRGSPKLPDRNLSQLGFTSQRQFTQFLYRGSLLKTEGDAVLRAIDSLTPMEQSLAELRRGFRAATSPAEVARGVDASFWPNLRVIPISRHPVDAIISACAAVNYLMQHGASARDLRAVERLQRGLCRIALGGYALSSKSIDLLAVLSRWDIETPVREVTSQGRRRLARALDRTIRTYVNASAWEPSLEARVDGDPRNEFKNLYLTVARKVNGAFTADPPHSPTSSSAQLLRLARVVVRFHDPENEEERRIAVDIADKLLSLAIGKPLGRGPQLEDTLLRREALLYLIEMGQILSDRRNKHLPVLDEVLRRAKDSDPRGNLCDLLAASEASGDWLPGANGEEELLREDQLGLDVVRTAGIAAATWPISESPFADALNRHLPSTGDPTAAVWRELTKQIALPTKDLLVEILVCPSSGRARTIGEALQSSGTAVRRTITAALSRMLQDDAVLEWPVLARRAAWTIGFAGEYSPATAAVLGDLAARNDVDFAIAADAAWALGDLVSSHPEHSTEGDAEVLRKVVASTWTDLADDPQMACQRLTRTQASLHSLAVQRQPRNAAVFSNFMDDSRIPEPPGGSSAYLRRARFLAQWGLELIDSPPALALAQGN